MKKRIVSAVLALLLILSLVPVVQAAPTITSLDKYCKAKFPHPYDAWDVYSGPGVYYFRANNWNASYGGTGVARVSCQVDNWLMIGYETSFGEYRIGYISADALKYVQYVEGTGPIDTNVKLSNVKAYADDYCLITDDPIMYNNYLCQLDKGQEVTVLGSMGFGENQWIYIESPTDYGLMRGFVHANHLSYTGGTPSVVTPVPATPAPYTPPTPVPYTPNPTAAPVVPNQYYHDSTRGSWLPGYQRASLYTGGPVYSGPGDYFYRAADGKAYVGSTSVVIYGVENGWAMIGYTLSNGSFRIGYVDAALLAPSGLRIAYLDFAYTTRQIKTTVNLTDDVVRYQPTVATLPAGTYVLFLAYENSLNTTWAYVEVLVNGSIMRGFIPASAL